MLALELKVERAKLTESETKISEVTEGKVKSGEKNKSKRSHRCLPLPPPSASCIAPPGFRCPEGGSRRTNRTHHLSPEEPRAASFTLQSLPI